MNPEPIWDWLNSVQFLGWYRVEGESSKFRNSVGYIIAMNALQCNAMATDAIMAEHSTICCAESAFEGLDPSASLDLAAGHLLQSCLPACRGLLPARRRHDQGC